MSESAVLEVSGCDELSGGSADSSRPDGGGWSQQDMDGCVPLLMQHGYDIAVKVDAPMKQLSTLETFVTYRVCCACARWSAPPPPYVRRRYNHFKALRSRLAAAYPLLPVPPLPPLHTARQQLDRYSAGLVALRTHALDAFLDRVAKHPILTHSEHLKLFLTATEEEVERGLRTEGGSLGGLWGLTGVLYNMGAGAGADAAKSQAVVARVKDPEFSAASDYLQSLQQKLTALGTITGRLCKDSAALGKELLSLKPAADAWCSHERGELAAAACAAGAGARGAGAARAGQGAAAARALLPQLAAYAGVVRDKILERDALHASYASSNNTADTVHNRLEQASEALRSELTDWNAKTGAEIKAHLLEIAERQLLVHQQSLAAWEKALKACRERPQPADSDDVFKTVSKTAVLNLSPSRAKDTARSETDVDLDDAFDDDGSNGDESLLGQIESPLGHFKSTVGQLESPLSSLGQIESSEDQSKLSAGHFESSVRQNESTLSHLESALSSLGHIESPLGQFVSSLGQSNDSDDDIVQKIVQEQASAVTELNGGRSPEVGEISTGKCHIRVGNGIKTDPLNDLSEIDLSKDS